MITANYDYQLRLPQHGLAYMLILLTRVCIYFIHFVFCHPAAVCLYFVHISVFMYV